MGMLGSISALGKRYLDGELRQQSLSGDVRLSNREDVPRLSGFSDEERLQLRQTGQAALQANRVAFGVLAAGASSRMSLSDLPADVAAMLQRSGKADLPLSKALVPVTDQQGRVYNYLDLFLINCRRLLEQAKASAKTVIFVSERNAGEIRAHLDDSNRQGISSTDVWDFLQPIEPQIVATVDDVTKSEANFPAEVVAGAKEFSSQYAGCELPVGKPAGHGEFLHQLVASGMLARLLDSGVTHMSVRNIDNVAAVIDDHWVEALGWMLANDSDILLEVSQRPDGQKGGALIQSNNAWRIAEDPSFRGTPWAAKDSYFMNNAVAIVSLRYLLKIYQTTGEEVSAGDDAKWQEIADRGRRLFPTLVDAKPVKLDDGQVVAAVIPETNMWESTGVIDGLVVAAMAVDSDRDAGDLLSMDPEERRARASRVRFSPTKNWDDYADERKQCISETIAARIVSGKLF
jgi:hypothetical protein